MNHDEIRKALEEAIKFAEQSLGGVVAAARWRAILDAQAEESSEQPALTADFTRSLPGGKWDDSAYEAVETALDKAEAPCQADGRWLTLPERVDALAAENFKLAAGVCEHRLGNEHGNAYCGQTGKLL